MEDRDQTVTSEQKQPADIIPTSDGTVPVDGERIVPTFVKPTGEQDVDNRAVVNPVTGGAL